MNMRERSFEVRRATRASRVAVLVLLIAAVIVASMPYWAGRDTLRDFTQIAGYLVFAMMWNLLAGYGGMVSIGQQAYFGIGGYAMLVLANYGGVSPFIAVPIAAVIAAVIAVPVSLVAFRLEGGYFAIGTWVIAEVFRLSVANLAWLGGGSGTSLTAFQGVPRALRESLTLWTALAIVAVAIGMLYVFLRSKRGLALTAMRDNAVAANSQGVDVKRARLVVYLVSAAGTALAGGLYFAGTLRISPDAAFSRELDRVRDLHRDDRRPWHARRSDHRHADLLPAEQVPVGLRDVVSDRPGRAGDRRHDVLSAGRLGLCIAAVWVAAFSVGSAGRVFRCGVVVAVVGVAAWRGSRQFACDAGNAAFVRCGLHIRSRT